MRRHDRYRKNKSVVEYDGEYIDKTEKALAHHGRDGKTAKTLRRLMKRNAEREFHYINVFSRKIFRQNVCGSIARRWNHIRLENHGYAFITIVHRKWTCNDQLIELDLKEIKKEVSDALNGVDFVACVEAGYYVDYEVEIDGVKGKLISIHVHAIVFDTSYRQLERVRERAQGRFTTIFESDSGPFHLSRRHGLKDVVDTQSI